MPRFSEASIKQLFGRSGNQCAHPDCSNPLIADNDNQSVIGDVAHIEALSEGGPRYNSKMTNSERNHRDNLVLLCPIHHKLIDKRENVKDYPVEILKRWRQDNEDKWKDTQTRDPNLLRRAIYAMFDADFPQRSNIPNRATTSFEIEAKIKHNAIKEKFSIVREYSVYHAKIDAIYKELENQGASFKTERLLRNIHDVYIRVKGSLVKDTDNEMEIIQENADYILDEVEKRLLESIGDPNLFEYGHAISIIMVDAFMRCKILEPPQL